MKFSLGRFAFPGWRSVLIVAFVAAAGWYFFLRDGTASDAILVIAPGDFNEQVSVSGTVVAARDADLGFDASGRISGIYVKVGQRVAAGTLFAQIENGDLVAALGEKRSALAEAEANLAALRIGTRPEEIAVTSAAAANAGAELIDAIQDAYTTSDDAIHNKADGLFTNPRSTNPKLTFSTSNASLKNSIESVRAAIESMLASWALLVASLSSADAAESAKQSQTYLARVVTLLADINAAVNQGVPDATVTAATLTSYQTTLATARANVNSVVAALTTNSAALVSAEKNLALKQAGATSEDLAAQEAAVAAARANVESAQAALAKTRVIAPFGGVVTRMDIAVGEIVSPSVSEFSLQSGGLFQIETFIPEVAIANVHVGDAATTTLDAYGSSAAFPATVVAVDPAETIKDGVPTYKTTLAFLTADPRIRSGMTADVRITTEVLKEAIIIPAGAVGTGSGGPYVTVAQGKGIVNRPVETGVTPSLGQIQIVSGLQDGDIILLTPSP